MTRLNGIWKEFLKIWGLMTAEANTANLEEWRLQVCKNSSLGIPIASPFSALHFPQCIVLKRWAWHPLQEIYGGIWTNGKSGFTQLSSYHKEESLGWSLKTVMKNEVGGSSAGNQAELPHHWPVDIPKGPFLTIQDFPLCLILFPVNPERVKRGREKSLYCFLFCHLSSPAPRG